MPALDAKRSPSDLIGADGVQQELEQTLKEFACLAIVDDYDDSRILMVSGTGLADGSR